MKIKFIEYFGNRLNSSQLRSLLKHNVQLTVSTTATFFNNEQSI